MWVRRWLSVLGFSSGHAAGEDGDGSVFPPLQAEPEEVKAFGLWEGRGCQRCISQLTMHQCLALKGGNEVVAEVGRLTSNQRNPYQNPYGHRSGVEASSPGWECNCGSHGNTDLRFLLQTLLIRNEKMGTAERICRPKPGDFLWLNINHILSLTKHARLPE